MTRRLQLALAVPNCSVLNTTTHFRLHSDRQAPPETASSFSIIDG
ncbi:hypothetical protein U1763_19365 [Sphingomonas sp. LB2R24]